MTPIKGYFSEANANRRQAMDAAAVGRFAEEKRGRMLAAEKDAEKKTGRSSRVVVTDELVLSILNLYVGGYGCSSIAHMMEMQEQDVFRLLQMPLLRYITGSRGVGVFYADTTKRIYPKVDAILAEVDALGMEPYAFGTMMMEKIGISRIYANRLIGRTNGYVPLPVALGVCEYFGMCADLLFRKETAKEKTAE